MISVLICGYNETYERNVKSNIAATIGDTYEILYHKNTAQLGICQVYNQLAQQASGDILCFVHEDVEFVSTNWAQQVYESLNKYDLIGIAGSKYKSRTPSTMGVNDHYCWNILQGFKYKTDIKKAIPVFHENHPEQTIEEAVCLDGVFLCIKKEAMQHLKFDEFNFSGFHGYDYDFCFGAKQQNLKLGVLKTIKIIHFSEGDTNAQWIDAQINLYKKWKSYLPIYTSDIKFSNPRYLEFLSFKQFFFKMRDNHYFKFSILLRLFRPIYIFYWLRYFGHKHLISKPKNS